MALLIPNLVTTSACGQYVFMREACPLPTQRGKPQLLSPVPTVTGTGRTLARVGRTQDTNFGQLTRLAVYRVLGPRITVGESVTFTWTAPMLSDTFNQSSSSGSMPVTNRSQVGADGRVPMPAVQRILYVDPAGNNGNSGLATDAAKATIQAAIDTAAASPNIPHAILLKAGATFTTGCEIIHAGVSNAVRNYIGRYGSGANPLISLSESSSEAGFKFNRANRPSNWIIQDIHFSVGSTSNPRYGVAIWTSCSNITVSGCKWFSTDNTYGGLGNVGFSFDPIWNRANPIDNAVCIGCVALDSYGSHGQGFYAYHVQSPGALDVGVGLQYCDCIGIGNGRFGDGRRSNQGHNWYMQGLTHGALFLGCTSLDSGFNGISTNLGCVIADCLIWDCPNGINVRIHPLTTVSRVVIGGGADGTYNGADFAEYGNGMEVQTAWNGDATPDSRLASMCMVSQVAVIHKDADTGRGTAFNIRRGSIGAHIVLDDCVVHEWKDSCVQFADSGAPGTDRYEFTNNRFSVTEGVTGERKCLNAIVSAVPPNLLASSNTWYSTATSRMFVNDGGTAISNTQWAAQYEPTAVFTAPSFPAKTRTLGVYAGSLGLTATAAAFVTAARAVDSQAPNTALLGRAAVEYLLGGFYQSETMPNQPPVANAGPDQTVTAGSNGDISVQLDGSASLDPDGAVVGYTWFEGATVISTAQKPQITRPPGTYTFTLYVTDNQGANSDGDDVDVTVLPFTQQNQTPVANAGPNQTVIATEGPAADVVLNGAGSSDDGSIVAYRWREGGSQIATGATPTVSLAVGSHTIELEVEDNLGLTATDVVVIVVNAGGLNVEPVAHAGPDQTVVDTDGNGSQAVTLDGSRSYDPAGFLVSYVWKEGVDTVATGARPTITPTVGVHTYTLTVTDNQGATDTDTVTITVEEPVSTNQPPVADAGDDQTVTDDDNNGVESIDLDGTDSTDPESGALTYQWRLNGVLIGVTGTLTRNFPVGVHVVELTVTDPGGLIAHDTVTITVNRGEGSNSLADRLRALALWLRSRFRMRPVR